LKVVIYCSFKGCREKGFVVYQPAEAGTIRKEKVMSLALNLMIFGSVIATGAFIFIGINMSRGGSFRKHIGGIIIMALGGLSLLIGLVLAGVEISNRLM
jgi:hypothetical protein